jgi:tetratricopeptide (TPR) repeat protein
MGRTILLLLLCGCLSATHAQTYKDYVRQALSAMSEDSMEQAEQMFREAMRIEPAQRSNAMIYYQIGRMQERREKYEKALESYTMGLNIASHLLPLRMARASLYMRLGNLDKALVDYSDVLDWKEDEQDALFMRAYIYTEQRLYKKARADYEALLRINPSHEKARVGLVLLNDKDNRPREAMEQINAMIATSPDYAMFYAIRAGMEQDRKQYEAAEEDFNRAIELEPGNTDYLLNRAMLYIATNRKKEARMDLDKALQLGADANEVASMRHLLR